jgi:Right handed beta helix region
MIMASYHRWSAAAPRAATRARLALEPLEHRTVPAPFIVTNLNDGGAGSLRQAITDANADALADIINFAPGLTGTINLNLAGADDTNVGGDLDILNPVSIQGPGAKVLTVKQTVANERVFDVRPGAGASVSISGLTITGGNGAAVNGGGGVNLATAAALTLSAVEITNNTNGGVGGGVFQNAAGSALTVLNSTIANNSSGAGSNGGGVQINLGSATITNSTISGNTAAGPNGGGVRIADATGSLTIRNCTITGNSSMTAGAGVSVIAGATVTLSSTIVAGNNPATAGDVGGAVLATSDHNLIGIDTGLTGITNGVNGNLIGTAATPINPLLGTLQFNGGPTRTHALLTGSPALNKGFDSVGLASDQRGIPFLRLSGVAVDIGAVEVQPNPQPTAQAFQAAVQAITLVEPSGFRLAAFAIGDVSGDFVSDIVLAFRLRNNKLLIATFDGVNGKIVGVFQPFPAAPDPGARVKLVTVNLNSDPALEIGIIVTPGSFAVPHISAFTVTGSRIL